jgi:hypothetical protein
MHAQYCHVTADSAAVRISANVNADFSVIADGVST